MRHGIRWSSQPLFSWFQRLVSTAGAAARVNATKRLRVLDAVMANLEQHYFDPSVVHQCSSLRTAPSTPTVKPIGNW
jgi:hypothetical protein